MYLAVISPKSFSIRPVSFFDTIAEATDFVALCFVGDVYVDPVGFDLVEKAPTLLITMFVFLSLSSRVRNGRFKVVLLFMFSYYNILLLLATPFLLFFLPPVFVFFIVCACEDKDLDVRLMAFFCFRRFDC